LLPDPTLAMRAEVTKQRQSLLYFVPFTILGECIQVDHRLLLSNRQFSAIKAYVSSVDRPKGGQCSRHLEGIIHKLQTGVDWETLPEVYGDVTAIRALYEELMARGTWLRVALILCLTADSEYQDLWCQVLGCSLADVVAARENLPWSLMTIIHFGRFL